MIGKVCAAHSVNLLVLYCFSASLSSNLVCLSNICLFECFIGTDFIQGQYPLHHAVRNDKIDTPRQLEAAHQQIRDLIRRGHPLGNYFY